MSAKRKGIFFVPSSFELELLVTCSKAAKPKRYDLALEKRAKLNGIVLLLHVVVFTLLCWHFCHAAFKK